VPWLLKARAGTIVVSAAAVLFLVASWPGPLTINAPISAQPLASPAAYLQPSTTMPAIYRSLQSLGTDAVVLELPFGNDAYEARYTFFAALHGRRVVNGFADAYPPNTLLRRRVLLNPLLDPDQSARALGGATHVVVHGNAWPDDTGVKVARWLETLGATPVAGGDGALLFQVQAPERFASRP
jgi:hypothetical protein